MKERESAEKALERWELLGVVQEAYPNFIPFLEEVMAELGFDTTEIQKDIGGFMEFGPQYLMVQAQRSQAKTTIAAAFCVWCLIHDPTHRILVVSAGGTQANEISTLIVRLIMNMDILECMRPDKMAGDRTAVDAFDVHHSLKGMDKSPSVGCFGIDSNIQGKRADLLLADDVESGKNSATALQRAKLSHITKDFTSINTNGRILWLGTPQSMESIYNSLPARGVVVRIWPGRYPTPEQIERYGDKLAPIIARRLAADPSLGTGGGLLGDQGKPIDPVLLGEEALQKKERDQGTAYFQLQHMLNTALLDSMRFPLKPERLILLGSVQRRVPLFITRGMDASKLRDFQVGDFAFKLTAPHELSPETSPFSSVWAYIDPAGGGQNGDETAYAVGGYLNGTIYLLSWGGLPGGYDQEVLKLLAEKIARYKPDGLTIEKNMGYGAFTAVFTPFMRNAHKCQILDDLVTGQKEKRIINTLDPIMGRGSLVVSEEAIREDMDTVMGYAPAMRQIYSGFFQLAKISLVRDCLMHDDRVDALEGLCRHFTAALARDQEKAIKEAREREWKERMKDPCGHNESIQIPRPGSNNVLARRLGRRR